MSKSKEADVVESEKSDVAPTRKVVLHFEHGRNVWHEHNTGFQMCAADKETSNEDFVASVQKAYGKQYNVEPAEVLVHLVNPPEKARSEVKVVKMTNFDKTT